MNFTLPVSTYLLTNAGYVSAWKAAQWVQVMEAYSTIVTGASALPWTMSGSGLGAISSSVATLVCASATPPKGGDEDEGCGAPAAGDGEQ